VTAVLSVQVKPHTDYDGTVESGLSKMLVIGMGKQRGARIAHERAVDWSFRNMIPEITDQLLESLPIVGDVAIVEDQHDDTAIIQGIPPERFLDREAELLETAEQRVDREREEVVAERNAYQRFKERVSGIDTMDGSRQEPVAATRTYVDSRSQAADPRSRMTNQIRNTFRETVMNVDHYDELYGESLETHVTVELSPEVATLFANDRATSITQSTHMALVTAVDQAISHRNVYLEVVDGERDPLVKNQRVLSDILEEYAALQVPAGQRSGLLDSLDGLAETRQETIQDRPSTAHTDGHDFCSYIHPDTNQST